MSSIVYQEANTGLACGLSWSVLSTESDKSNRVSSRIRKQAGMVNANKHVINTLQVDKYLGLYSTPVLETKTPKRLFSLAMAFLSAAAGGDKANKTGVNAILMMTPQDNPQRRVVVVIEGGQIIHDRLENAADALGVIKEYRQDAAGISYNVYSDGYEISSAGEITWAHLLTYCSATSQLQSIPINTTAALVSLAILTAALGFGAYHYLVVAPAKLQAEKLAQQAALDHTPQYLQKLNAELARAGWDRADLAKTLDQLVSEYSYIKGWVLEQISCDVDTQNCSYKFARMGGEVSELIQLQADKSYDASQSGKESAVFSKPFKPAVLELKVANIPEVATASVELMSKTQRLTNANVSVTNSAPIPWPTAGLDMSKVNKKVVVKQTGFESKSPYVLTSSVIAELPASLMLRSFVISVATSGDKANFLILNLKGHSYAK